MSHQGLNDNYPTDERIAEIVRETIEADRESRKHGRSDQGRGGETLGLYVVSARRREGMSQAVLAKLSGLHPTTVGKIEAGLRGMSLFSFSRLSGVLGMDFARDVIAEVGQWPN